MPGPIGPQGIQGIAGTTGETGETGNDGTNGVDGAVGAKGEQGEQGIKGDSGIKGTDGTNGVNGTVGLKGDKGEQGIKGDSGIKGTDGTNGVDGAVGATGTAGIGGVSKAGNNINITGAGSSASPYIVTAIINEVDGSITNEIQNLSEVLTENNSAGNANITKLANPVNGQDAATKSYVDLLESRLNNLETAMVFLKGVTDYDGNTYDIIEIGTQVWMAENLKVTHYPNGDVIPLVDDNFVWHDLSDNDIFDAYSYYYNKFENAETYGALYTYAAAIGDNWVRDNVENQGVCPDGWHLPSDVEWITLTDYLGGDAGGKMKEIGTNHWSSPNEGADNSSGFFARPGGFRYSFGEFNRLGGEYGYWWSSTEDDSSDAAYYRKLDCNSADVYRSHFSKSFGMSVRCLRD